MSKSAKVLCGIRLIVKPRHMKHFITVTWGNNPLKMDADTASMLLSAPSPLILVDLASGHQWRYQGVFADADRDPNWWEQVDVRLVHIQKSRRQILDWAVAAYVLRDDFFHGDIGWRHAAH